MIVNGQTEFVGSNKVAASRAIDAQLKAQPKYDLSIKEVKWQGNEVSIDYALDKIPTSCQLRLAVVEKSVWNQVPSGENSGRKLHHDNVVRAFQTIRPELSGKASVTLVKANTNNLLVIVYLQGSDLTVLAAASKAIQ